MFVHLTTHSSYSFQESLLTPADLVQAARRYEMPAVSLTDHLLLTGAVEFVQACREANIQPLLGLEIDLDFGRISLLALSREGWASLCRLTSTLALRAHPEAPCTIETLERNASGLIVLCQPQMEAHLQNLKDIFQDRFYLTLDNPTCGIPTTSLARKLGSPASYVKRCDRTIKKDKMVYHNAARTATPTPWFHFRSD